jgi:hypothetical protein
MSDRKQIVRRRNDGGRPLSIRPKPFLVVATATVVMGCLAKAAMTGTNPIEVALLAVVLMAFLLR